MVSISALALFALLTPIKSGADLLDGTGVGPSMLSFTVTGSSFANTSSFMINGGKAQFMSGPDSAYGGFDRTAFTFSLWYSRDRLTNNSMGLLAQRGNSGQRAFYLLLNDNDTLEFALSTNNSAFQGQLVTTNALATLSNWIHVTVAVNLLQAISTNKIKMWTNTVGATPTECKLAISNYPSSVNAMFNSTNSVNIGSNYLSGASFWGQIDEVAFVSGSNNFLPSDFEDGSGRPKDLSGMAGLFFWARGGDNGINHDEIKTTDWTNNASVVGSPRVP